MMVGSYFYLARKSDWNHLSIYQSMVKYHENKILRSEGEDLYEKVDMLEEYVKDLEYQLDVLQISKVLPEQ